MKPIKPKQSVRPQHEETLYVKRGGKYVHCSDPWAITGLRDGFWFVHVRPGQTSIRKPVWPDLLGLSATIEMARDSMEQAIGRAVMPRAKTGQLLTPKACKLWRDYCKEVGGESEAVLWSASIHDIVDAGIKALK